MVGFECLELREWQQQKAEISTADPTNKLTKG